MGSLDVLCPVGTDGAATKKKLPLPELKSVSNSEHQSSAYLTWEKVVRVLYIVRRHRISEYDPKRDAFVPIHFCSYNISFFDFKRESNVGLGDPFHKLPSSLWKRIVDSVNVISLKVLQSDVGYPISLYGTVIARDEIDYRCVYLFRRCRDDPQVIKSPKDMLTLTGPHRGLAVLDSMFFEVDLRSRMVQLLTKILARV